MILESQPIDEKEEEEEENKKPLLIDIMCVKRKNTCNEKKKEP